MLVRDERLLQASFDAEASYVHEDAERVEHEVDFGRIGPQFSRGFQALKIWVSLLAHGRRAYSDRIAHDAALARYLAECVEAHDAFELVTPARLSICCFEFVPPDLPAGDGADAYRNAQRTDHDRPQLDGRVTSNAVLGDRFVLRARGELPHRGRGHGCRARGGGGDRVTPRRGTPPAALATEG